MNLKAASPPILLTAHDWYAGIGIRTFPVRLKKPVFTGWQTEDFSKLSQWSGATGIGIVVAEGWCVVDIDLHVPGCARKGRESEEGGVCACESPDAIARQIGGSSVVCRTGSGGLHLYFQDPTHAIPCSTRGIHRQVDTKSHGNGYVLAPPSFHEQAGKFYTWESYPNGGPDSFPQVPAVLQKAFSLARRAKKDYRAMFINGSADGDRSKTAASLAGYLWTMMAPVSPNDITEEHLHFLEAVLRNWDTRNRPPLGEEEINRIAKSVGKTRYDRLCASFDREIGRS